MYILYIKKFMTLTIKSKRKTKTCCCYCLRKTNYINWLSQTPWSDMRRSIESREFEIELFPEWVA